jgi:hypothetical protein
MLVHFLQALRIKPLDLFNLELTSETVDLLQILDGRSARLKASSYTEQHAQKKELKYPLSK